MPARFRLVSPGPTLKPVAVLATLAAAVAADCAARGETAAIAPTVLIGLIAGTLLTGVALFLFGSVKTGRWIRYVPYPVIGGFMAASGWLLFAGAVRVLTGVGIAWNHLDLFLEGNHPLQLGVGVAFAVAIVLVRRVKHFLAFPAFLAVGTALVLAVLHAAGFSMAEARAADGCWTYR